MTPKNNPPSETLYAKKFRKNVEEIICITIRKGRITPVNDRRNPIKIKPKGDDIKSLLI